LGGQSDWFLPSLDELHQMETNLYRASPPLGGFSTEYYWSSSEVDVNFAWLQLFHYGGQEYDFKSYLSYVRPVRAFYLFIYLIFCCSRRLRRSEHKNFFVNWLFKGCAVAVGELQ
jgi:hypothetical protein